MGSSDSEVEIVEDYCKKPKKRKLDLSSSTSSETSSFELSESDKIDAELRRIDIQMKRLKDRKAELIEKKERLTDAHMLKKSKSLGDEKVWETKTFPWRTKVENILQEVFHIDCFRPCQLAAINATLSKKNVILVMPTGGGKSLCFQLPALIDKGMTLVVSPMVSLIEDQVMALKSLNIAAEMLATGVETEDANRILKMMVSKTDELKLLYVTPERLAKSKRFMTNLQKCYEAGYLARIVVDEVHCCSSWGHDFRTDYQYLSVLREICPDVPVIGVTATATTKIMLDVQKILLIQGCIVFRSSFNRPNLFYEVREKPSDNAKGVEALETLLKSDFKGQSGIIYVTTTKECDALRQELRERGCKVGAYHAHLGENYGDSGASKAEIMRKRSAAHKKWISGEYQAIVATIAFGLGIDKPDVRFVIHYSLSKSMENYYQESGRAGRDGEPSRCVLFYRFSDIFKLSMMVFTQRTGLKNLYSMVEYCLNSVDCRRKIIASHFEEEWDCTECKKMCDNCEQSRDVTSSVKSLDVAKHYRNICDLLDAAANADVKLTPQMLLDVWCNGKTVKRVVKPLLKANERPSYKRSEYILARLMILDYLKEDFHYTPYSTITYIKRGSKCISESSKAILIEAPRNRSIKEI